MDGGESQRRWMKRENQSQCRFVAVSNLLETALKGFTGMNSCKNLM
jgi:hypothetical protein